MREIRGIPVRQPDAAGGFAVSDAAGIRRSMDSVMRLGKSHQDHAGRISRTRGQLRRGLIGARVPEMHGVIVEPRIMLHAGDRPMPDWQRVVLTSDSRRVLS